MKKMIVFAIISLGLHVQAGQLSDNVALNVTFIDTTEGSQVTYKVNNMKQYASDSTLTVLYLENRTQLSLVFRDITGDVSFQEHFFIRDILTQLASFTDVAIEIPLFGGDPQKSGRLYNYSDLYLRILTKDKTITRVRWGTLMSRYILKSLLPQHLINPRSVYKIEKEIIEDLFKGPQEFSCKRVF